MKIRKANEKDAEDISLVLKICYNIDSIEEGKKVFFSEMKKGFNYIACEVEGKVVGITTWVMHGLPKHGLVELDRIAVLPDYRGEGAARQLFEGLIQSSSEYMQRNDGRLRKLYLLTHASNERAHKFYEKMGLTHETTLKKHYYDDEDELVYSKFFS